MFPGALTASERFGFLLLHFYLLMAVAALWHGDKGPLHMQVNFLQTTFHVTQKSRFFYKSSEFYGKIGQDTVAKILSPVGLWCPLIVQSNFWP